MKSNEVKVAESVYEELVKLRRKWRTEATMRRKCVEGRQGQVSQEYYYRNVYEADVFDMCANKIDALLRK
jgi:hypothetical protein